MEHKISLAFADNGYKSTRGKVNYG